MHSRIRAWVVCCAQVFWFTLDNVCEMQVAGTNCPCQVRLLRFVSGVLNGRYSRWMKCSPCADTWKFTSGDPLTIQRHAIKQSCVFVRVQPGVRSWCRA